MLPKSSSNSSAFSSKLKPSVNENKTGNVRITDIEALSPNHYCC